MGIVAIRFRGTRPRSSAGHQSRDPVAGSRSDKSQTAGSGRAGAGGGD
ncbi:hypothetical protein HMPREF0185_03510 [Brevundimonas diminuta 470-4]|nr:hypothetical protein HMPREF0185_03510 [Brevundimonas diminuta 470-4]